MAMQAGMGRRWTLLGYGSLVACVVVYAVVLAFYHGTSRGAVLDIMNVVPPLAAALACAFASANAGSRSLRWFWALIAVGLLCTACAEATWAWYELVLRVETPYPSWADAEWIAFYPLICAGLFVLAFRQGSRRYLGIASVLDGLLYAVAAAGLGWELLVRPAMDPTVGALGNLTNMAYPVGDLLLMAGLVSIAVGPGRGKSPRGTRWLFAAFLLTFIADIAYTRMVASGSYATGSSIDLMWPLSYALMGVSAVAYMAGSPRGQVAQDDARRVVSGFRLSPSEVLRRFMPYVAVLSAAFLVYYHFLVKGGGSRLEDTFIIAVSICLPTLVILRQLVVVVENRKLQAELAQLSSELEERVEERTQELAAEKAHLALLNEAAAVMSRCVTTREVASAGLRLVVQATACDGALLSVATSGGRPQVVASEGTSKAGQHQLRWLLRTSPRMQQAAREDAPTRLDGEDVRGRNASPSARWPFQSAAVIPLISRGEVLGTLCVAYGAAENVLSDDEFALGQGIASLIAVALESARRYDEAAFLAERDPVTGLLNHRGISKRLEQEVARSERAGSCFAVVMMDLDNFKLFNDTYGHVTGDQVLASTSATLEKAVRRSDIVGRFGGDEFVGLLPDTDAAGAQAIVERIRHELANNPFRTDNGSLVPLLMSCGVAVYPFQGRRPSELLVVADANLYRSKQRGGDCVTTPDTADHRRDVQGGVFTVLDGLVNTVDNKDHYTRRHSDDVTEFAVALATGLGLSSETQRSLRIAGLLHDVGKIGIPDRILRKPGPLSDEEFDTIKTHVGLGELIIKEIPNLDEVLAAVAAHHERYDGKGYPRGLAGEQIPLLGRILAVTDAYSAMTADRPYRKAFTPEQAQDELRRVAGTQLDAKIVEAFLRILRHDAGRLAAVETESAQSVA